jgi:hypothetical protein
MMMSQGFEPSNTHAGVKDNNTKIFDLTSFGENGPITGIRVFWANHIVGLEFAFGGQSTGVLKGYTNISPFEDRVELSQGDYITEIFGRYSHEITCFGFRTAKGFNRVWGNPTVGESFKFSQQNHYIKALKIGAHENISYLEPIYDDINFLYAKKLEFSNNGKFSNQLGKLHGDTEGFEDFDWIKDKFNYSVAEVKVWHDGRLVHGVQFSYNIDGTKKTPGKHVSEAGGLKCEHLILNEDEHIVKILVRAGDLIDSIVLFTDQGRKVGGGGPGGIAYLAVLPQYHQFIAVDGGIGNCLHNVRLHYDEIY